MCTYVLKPVLFIVSQLDDEWKRPAPARFGKDWDLSVGDAKLVKWLMPKSGAGGANCGLTNIKELFMWVMSVVRM